MSIGGFIEGLLEFFPYLKEEMNSLIEFDDGEILYTIIIERVFMPEVIKLLETESDIVKLKDLFDFFEKVSTCDNKVLVENYFSVTVLEILGNDEKILNIAKKYMGQVTTKLQREADLALGRKV